MSKRGMSLDLLRVAARVTVPEACPVCKALMLYDDGRDAYVCDCGFADVNGPAESADFEKVATAIASGPSGKISCIVELSLSVEFDGSVSNKSLVKKFKSELLAALKSAASITAKELRLKASELRVEPPTVETVFVLRDKA